MLPKILVLLLMIGWVTCEGRWSRQIAGTGFSAAAINDWIPINQPCPTCHNGQESRRETSGRVLNFPQSIQNSVFQSGSQLPLANSQSQPFPLLGEPFTGPHQFVLAQAEQINQLQQNSGVPFQLQQPPPQQQPQIVQQQQQQQQQHQVQQSFNQQGQPHVQHFIHQQQHQQHQLQPPQQQQPFLLPQENVPLPQPPPQFKMKYQIQHPAHQHHNLFQQGFPQHVLLPQQQFQPNLPPQLQPIQQQKQIEQFRQIPPPQQQEQQRFLPQNSYKFSTEQPQQQFIKQEEPKRQPQQQQYHFIQQGPQHNNNAPKPQPQISNQQQQYHFVQQEPQVNTQQIETPKPQQTPQQYHFITQAPPPIPVTTPKLESYIKPEVSTSPKPEQQQYYSHPNQIKNAEQQNEEIQLLYVPLDTLLKKEKQNYQTSNYYSSGAPETSTIEYNPRKTSRRPTTTSTTTTTQRTQYVQTVPTTQKHKPKPHQPPLAIFMVNENYRKENRVIDVLLTLRYANTIDVIDTPTNDNPSIFIGPFDLTTPIGYSKFGLPYLSNLNINKNRLDDMTYFVAPQSYKPTKEFNKIPLPSPHVGALIIRIPQTQYSQYQPTAPISSSTTSRPTTSRSTTSTTTTEATPSYESHNFYSSTPLNYYEKNQNINDYQYNQYTSPTPPKTERSKNRYQYTDDYIQSVKSSENENTQQYNTSPIQSSQYVEQSERVKSVPTTISFEEVQRMKNYFKEQQDFKRRPTVADVAPPAVEVTPNNYNQNEYISSTSEVPVEKYSIGNQQNQEQNYYTNNNYQAQNEYQPPAQQQYEIKHEVQTNSDDYSESRQPHKISSSPKEQHLTVVPLEKDSGEYVSSQNSYSLPSELPVISPHLPSMINNLFEGEPEEFDEKTTTLRTSHRVPTKSRRPIPTRRAPVTTEATTSAETYPTDTTTKRVTNRARQPQPTRGTYNPTRANVIRNPNRVRYNPTNEERQHFRSRKKNKPSAEDNLEYQRDVLNQNYPVIKPTTPITTSTTTTTTTTTTTETPEIDQDYNQQTELNYQTNPFAYQDQYYQSQQQIVDQQKLISPSTETSNYQGEQQYTHKFETSSSTTTQVPYVDENYAQQNHQNDQTQYFKEIQGHMQIPENQSKSKYSQTYPDVYYENEPLRVQKQPQQEQQPQESYEEESIDDRYKVEVGNPVYIPTTTELTTTSTSTTEKVEYSTDRNELFKLRRPSFGKRPAYSGHTTESSSAGTTTSKQDKFTLRSRKRFESGQNTTRPSVYRSRVRSRVTTTTQPPEEDENIDNNRYNKNQDNYETSTQQRDSAKPTRGKYTTRNRSRFQLETQESQWSPALSLNSFQPVDPNSAEEDLPQFKSNEPEIVTAGPENDGVYLVTVTPESNFSIYKHKNQQAEENRYPQQYEATTTTTTTSSTTVVPDSNQQNDTISFADMLEDFMSDFSNDLVGKNDPKSTESSNESTQVSNKNDIENGEEKVRENKKSGGKRRGVWRKVRVRPADTFETAESQNIGSQIFNSLSEHNNKNSEKEVKFQLNTFEYADKSSESETTTLAEPEEEKQPETTMAPLTETTTENLDDFVDMTGQPENLDNVERTSTEMFDQLQPTELIAPAETETFEGEHRKMDQNDTYHEEEPKEPSLFDEVKKKLNDLFSQEMDDEDEDMIDGNSDPVLHMTNDFHVENNETDQDYEDIPLVKQFKPKYQSINRLRKEKLFPVAETTTPTLPETLTESQQSVVSDPIGMLIYATSTSKEVSHETEICYRGRCVKTDEKKKKIKVTN